MSSALRVCVTGASGFVGSAIVREFLRRGHSVHGTVRDANDATRIAHLQKIAAEFPNSSLKLFSADLTGPSAPFAAAMAGCQAVCHAAAVVRFAASDPQREIVDVAVRGTETVLRAMDEHKDIRKLVMLSSVAAVVPLDPADGMIFDEKCWNLSATTATYPYGFAKTRSEQVVWEYVERRKSTLNLPDLQLVVLNPVVVFGPYTSIDHTRTSPGIPSRILRGDLPGYPNLNINIVDVRDVAEAAAIPLERDNISGRFILHAENRSMEQIFDTIRTHYTAPQFRIPSWRLPNWLVLVGSIFSKDLSFSMMWRSLGRVVHFDNSRARDVLGITFRSADESILETCRSAVDLGFVKPRT